LIIKYGCKYFDIPSIEYERHDTMPVLLFLRTLALECQDHGKMRISKFFMLGEAQDLNDEMTCGEGLRGKKL
jgi:hypothetical protein